MSSRPGSSSGVRRGGRLGLWGWRGLAVSAVGAWGRLVQRASAVLTGRLRHLGRRRVLGLGRATAAGARCIAAGHRFGLAALGGCRGLRTGLPLLGAGGAAAGPGLPGAGRAGGQPFQPQAAGLQRQPHRCRNRGGDGGGAGRRDSG